MSASLHKNKKTKGPADPKALKSRDESPDFRTPAALTIKEVQNRADTITPCLKELLEFRAPPRWDK
jgi:hypothetical protein